MWAISTSVFNICQLAKSFSSCFFSWINRSGNAVAHVTTKYSIDYLGSLCFVPGNLPASLAVVCEEDALVCLSFWFNTLKFTKKIESLELQRFCENICFEIIQHWQWRWRDLNPKCFHYKNHKVSIELQVFFR